MIPACTRCRFWDADSDRRLTGWCRFNPPRQVHDLNQVIKSNWPPTGGDDWCGQFSPAPVIAPRLTAVTADGEF